LISEPAIYFLYAAFLGFLLFTSWLRWPDAWMDFGFFLYDSWIVSEGARIGVDLHYYYGPLALPFYAFLFKLFGAGLPAVYGTNLIFLAVNIILLHHFFLRFSRGAAVAAVICFLGVFAVGQYVFNGNYNFIAPYKPEISLGTPLLLLQCLLSVSLGAAGWRRNFTLIGLLCGALALTSSELALAALAALAVLVVTRPPAGREWMELIGGFSVLPAAFLFWFKAALPWPQAFSVTFRAFTLFFRPSLVFDPILRELMGLDYPLLRLGIALGALGAFFLLAVLCLFAGQKGRSPLAQRVVGGCLVFALPCAVVFSPLRDWFWLLLPKCLPAFPLLGLFLWARDRRRYLALGLWSALSLALLVRVIGNARFFHYGFSLATGATLLLFPLLIDILPELLERKNIRSKGLEVFAWGLCAALLVAALPQRARFFGDKNFPLSRRGDVLYDTGGDSGRGPVIRGLLDYLEPRLTGNDTVLGLPYGHIVNYLLRARRPGSHSLALGELNEFGEAEILAEYRRYRPRFVFVSPENGFGVRFGMQILGWLREDYRPVKTFGGPQWWITLYEAR
jgi:hypothetical protein